MEMRELRNHAVALALLLMLGAFAACATRDGGPQSGTGVGGGAVTAPASAGAQPAVPGTPDNPTEQPPSGVTPGTAMGETAGGSDTMDASAEAARVDCSTVRCAACPEGQTPR